MAFSRRQHRLVYAAALVLFVLGVFGLLFIGGTVSHVHGHAGLHNQEHDLSYLATFGHAGLLPHVATAMPLAFVVLLAIIRITSQSFAAPKRHADFRAPPAR